jgi:peptide/nickel transport system substrate-binding protein
MLSLLLIAALSAPSSAAVKNPDTLVYAQFWPLLSMDPAWSENMSPLYNVYEPLVDFRGAGATLGDLVPALARKVPSRANGLISKDGLTYRFPIRKGVTLHDGTALTPEDVRYSLLRFMLLDRPGGASSALLEPVLGVSSTREGGKPVEDLYERAAKAVAVDGDAVVVRLARPFAPFLTIVANFGRVTGKACAAAHGQWDGRAGTWKEFNGLARERALPDAADCGTGPFTTSRYDAAAGQLVLSRWERYWRRPARLSRVVIKSVPELLTRRLMLQAGDADIIAVPPRDAAQFNGLKGVAVIQGLRKLQDAPFLVLVRSVDGKDNELLGSGALDGKGVPPDFFSDPDVRAGFALSVDRKVFAEQVAGGKDAGVVPAALIPGPLTGHRDSSLRFDAAAAREHFKKAFGGRLWNAGFTLPFVFPAVPDERYELANLLRADLAAINPKFVVEPKPVTIAAFADLRQKRRMPFHFGQWTADYPDPHDFAFPLVHSGGVFSAMSGFKDLAADALIEKAAAEPDQARRDSLYGSLAKIVDEDLPLILLPVHGHARVQRTWVRGFVFNPARHNLPYDSYYYDLSKGQ